MPAFRPSPPPRPRPRFSFAALKLPAILVATLLLSVLIYCHTPGIDGPWYAHHGFHRAPAMQIFPLMALSALPLFAAVFLFDRTERPAIPLLLVMLSTIGFALVSIGYLANEPSWRPMIELTRNPMALSYFADASALVMGQGNPLQWLESWPQLLPEMFLHSQTKPPGPVLYFAAFIHFFGVTDRAAFIADLFTACLIALTVPMTYWLARVWRARRGAAFHTAVCIALFPSITQFFPSLDAVYAIASCGLIGLWTLAIRRDSAKAAIAFGVVLALITFFVYNILVLGVMLVGIALLAAPRDRRTETIIRQSAAALATVAAIYALLWLITGFDPIACFGAAMHNQSHLLPGFDRPYPATIFFDLLDFSMGVGWLSVALALIYLFHRTPPPDPDSPPIGPARAFIVIALLQLLIVAATGLLPGETARVWAFLTPLIAVPAGAELSRWPRPHRLAAYACMFVILTLLAQNLHETHGTNAPLVGQSHPSTR